MHVPPIHVPRIAPSTPRQFCLLSCAPSCKAQSHKILSYGDPSLILCQDYDCFYAAVFEKEDPKLRDLPFAVQQKQIIVTCNYEARRRGLYKLQLVREAKHKCPDLIIALGEDLTRFRNASKDNYEFLRQHTWSNRVERLGFDEVRLSHVVGEAGRSWGLVAPGIHGRD